MSRILLTRIFYWKIPRKFVYYSTTQCKTPFILTRFFTIRILLFCSTMGSSLSSMSAQSCLQQQREAYPYMFHHDPLSSLASASYGRSCGATQSAQSHMGSYGSSLTSSGGSQGAGKLFSILLGWLDFFGSSCLLYKVQFSNGFLFCFRSDFSWALCAPSSSWTTSRPHF